MPSTTAVLGLTVVTASDSVDIPAHQGIGISQKLESLLTGLAYPSGNLVLDFNSASNRTLTIKNVGAGTASLVIDEGLTLTNGPLTIAAGGATITAGGLGIGVAAASFAGITLGNPITASGGNAYGLSLGSALTATADGDTLYGLRVSPTLSLAGHTGVSLFGVYIGVSVSGAANTYALYSLSTAASLLSGALTTTQLNISAATSKIVPGATSLSLRNNADGADNLLLSDAGVATVRVAFAGPGTVASAGDIRLANTAKVTWRNATNSADLAGLSYDASNRLTLDGTSTGGTATAGANGAPPAQVAGYLIVVIGGVQQKIPYYNT